MPKNIILIVIGLLVLSLLVLGLKRYFKANPNSLFSSFKGWLYTIIIFLCLSIIFASLPIDNFIKSSVFSLLGLFITAVIAISSTTFASNTMAGIMLRMIRHFRPGDFIEVGEHFGRVSEMRWLHTEIQTKNRNLTTLPNLYLVTNAVTVIPSDKALIDATLSLGYDVSHHDIEPILLSAAKKIGLTDAFVQVTELGDFSISYRVAGFWDNPKLLLTARSNLRKQVIDSLHSKGVEIVSPTFMNQRQYHRDEIFISEVKAYQERQNSKTEKSQVFDKAEIAEKIEMLKNQLQTLETEFKMAKENKNEEKQTNIAQKKIHLQEEIDQLTTTIESDETT